MTPDMDIHMRNHMPHATCRMPHAACRMPHAACHMPHATCHMPHATCRMPHAHARVCGQVRYDWKSKELRTALLAPPDTAEGIMMSVKVLERLQRRRKERAAELGLSPTDAAAAFGSDDDDDDDDGGGDDDGVSESDAREVAEAARDVRASEAHRARGATLVKAQDWAGALAAFDAAAAADARCVKAQLNRSLVLLQLGHHRAAVLAADRALHLSDGRSAKAWFRRANAFFGVSPAG
eukprot:6109373-Prymnesium_polylepis.1